MFAPRLRQRFQFHISGVAPFSQKIGANSLHLRQIQRQSPRGAEGFQFGSGGGAQGDNVYARVRFLVRKERGGNGVINSKSLHYRVGEQFCRQARQALWRQLPRQHKALPGGGPRQPVYAQPARGAQQIFRGRVGHARQERYLDGVQRRWGTLWLRQAASRG